MAKETEKSTISHELAFVKAGETLTQKPLDEVGSITEMDDYISRQNETPFSELFKLARIMKRLSGLYKSRLLFAFMHKHSPKIPPYADFVKEVCEDDHTFCNESHYNRHRQAVELLSFCADENRAYFSSFSEFSLRKLVSATKKLNDTHKAEFLSSFFVNYGKKKNMQGSEVSDCVDAVKKLLSSGDEGIKDAPTLKPSQMPKKIARCQTSFEQILKTAEKKHVNDHVTLKRVEEIQNQIQSLIKEIEGLFGLEEAPQKRKNAAARQEAEGGK